MSDQHEAAIAQGLRAGETDAWRALYDRHARQVWRLAARLMGPVSADVADVVQETFLAAARSARNYDASRGSLWMWLSGIARIQVASHYRREKRAARSSSVDGHLAAGSEQIVRWLEGGRPSPPEALAAAELSSLVRTTLAGLPTQYETLLITRYLDGVAVEYIAEQEGTSATAVRSRLARARRAFRRAFGRTSASPAGAESGEPHGP
jgi:RNA polymerase sigma-70 factor (ECF subfamily)